MTGLLTIFTNAKGDLCVATRLDQISYTDEAKLVGALMTALDVDLSNPGEVLSLAFAAYEVNKDCTAIKADLGAIKREAEEAAEDG